MDLDYNKFWRKYLDNEEIELNKYIENKLKTTINYNKTGKIKYKNNLSNKNNNNKKINIQNCENCEELKKKIELLTNLISNLQLQIENNSKDTVNNNDKNKNLKKMKKNKNVSFENLEILDKIEIQKNIEFQENNQFNFKKNYNNYNNEFNNDNNEMFGSPINKLNEKIEKLKGKNNNLKFNLRDLINKNENLEKEMVKNLDIINSLNLENNKLKCKYVEMSKIISNKSVNRIFNKDYLKIILLQSKVIEENFNKNFNFNEISKINSIKEVIKSEQKILNYKIDLKSSNEFEFEIK